MSQQSLTLPDGRRVRYAIKGRPGDPFYFVIFRGVNGRRLERSTKENSQKRAMEAACQIITEEYTPKLRVENFTWDEAVDRMVVLMKAKNLRPQTIRDYRYAIRAMRKVLAGTRRGQLVSVGLAKEFKGAAFEGGVRRYRPLEHPQAIRFVEQMVHRSVRIFSPKTPGRSGKAEAGRATAPLHQRQRGQAFYDPGFSGVGTVGGCRSCSSGSRG